MSYITTDYTRRHAVGKTIFEITKDEKSGRIKIKFVDGSYLLIAPDNDSILSSAYDKNDQVIAPEDDDSNYTEYTKMHTKLKILETIDYLRSKIQE